MVFVVATIEIAEGHRDDFLNEFRKLVPKVLAEEGCIEYGPAVDVDTGIDAQQPLRDNVVVVMEKWESIDALKAHLQAPHMAEYRKKVQELVVDLNLEVLGPAA